MYLSDAIRLGSLLGPQAKGKFYDEKDGGMCGMGAALAAEGKLDKDTKWNNHDIITKTWGYVDARPVWTEDCRFCSYSIRNTVVYLNNRHGWTRERIADWVEEQEVRLGVRPAIAESTPIEITEEAYVHV